MDIEKRVERLEEKVNKVEQDIPRIFEILSKFGEYVDKFGDTVEKLEERLRVNDIQTSVNATKKLSTRDKIFAFVGSWFGFLVALQMILNQLGGK